MNSSLSLSFAFYSGRCRPISLHLLFSCILALASVTTSSAVIRNGTNLGPIPDGTAPNPTCGAPRDVFFDVSNQTTPLGSVSVSFTMTHTWVGDLQVFLIAPDTTSHLLFSYVGRVPPVGSGFGDNSNLSGTYNFSDTGTMNIWQQAAAGGDAFNIPPGNYRTQAAGPFTPVNPGPPFTSINAAFAGVTAPNGIWMLRFLDCAAADLGTVTAATLTLFGPSAAAASISGRVATESGRGISNTSITVSGGTLETPRAVVSNSFGYFRVSDLPVGQTYIVTARSKRFFIFNSVETITLFDDFTGLNFIAQPF